MLKKIINYLCRKTIVLFGSESYANFLRKQGVSVGKNFKVFNLSTINIDLSRPSLITIGNNVAINRNFTLLTHDFVSGLFIRCYSDVLPSTGHVIIGNNVRTGQNVTILKGVTIGDNVFIGANSLVTKDIPSNSIAGGNPCKVILSLDDYYSKRKEACISEAFEFAQSIKDRYNRLPTIYDFREEYSLYIDRSNYNEYPEIHSFIREQLGEHFDNYMNKHKAIYPSFEAFLKAAGVK